jgi:hypothetical protein
LLGVPPSHHKLEFAVVEEFEDVDCFVLVPEEKGEQTEVLLKLLNGDFLVAAEDLQLLVQVTGVQIGGVGELLPPDIVVLEPDD